MPNEIYHRSEWGNPKAEGFGDVYFDASATNKLYNHSDYYENSDGTDKILRDIPNKASIVLTPTAYSDGSLNTVIPPYQVLPQELVTNGTFDTDLSGWSIINSDATHTVTHTSDGARFQSDTTSPILFFQTNDNVLQGGKKYLLTIEIVSLNSGSVKIQGNGIEVFFSENGVFSNIVKPTSNTPVKFYRNTSDVDLTIKSVSVKEIQEADFDFSRASVATRVNEKGLIEDVASNIPRIDYTSGQGALLLEPQSTNLITYSEDFSQWIPIGTPTVDLNNIVSPDGDLNGTKVTRGSNATPLRKGTSNILNNAHTFTLYAKKGNYDKLGLDIGDEEQINFTLTDEWQRFEVTSTPTTYNHVDITLPLSSSGDYIYIFGAQLEQKSFKTSYIPTEGATVTRSADVANNSGNADLFNDSEGVLYAQIADFDNDSFRQLTVSNGSASNTVSIMNTTTENQVVCFVNDGGVTQASISTFLHSTHQFNKIAIKYKANDFSVYINGFEIGTDTSGTVPTGLNTLNFDNGAGSGDVYGNTKELAVFKEALTDAELESLTSWISFVEMATDLEYTLE